MADSRDDAEQRRARREAAERRRRLDAVFGSGRMSSSDESGDGWGERDDVCVREAELRRDVPPHHGGH